MEQNNKEQNVETIYCSGCYKTFGHIAEILKTCNNTKHSLKNMTPTEASEKKNEGIVYFNLHADIESSSKPKFKFLTTQIHQNRIQAKLIKFNLSQHLYLFENNVFL